ncbi:MAG TPA: hypothetical protein VN376_03800 [Longilinea sp.]|nr:hypothetical protein [Longilinea sp.]
MISAFPDPEALILVAVMTQRRDLEIARLLGWYRIPLRYAPKIVDVDYLAFFQTTAFGEDHRWLIEYIAPVQGHELTTRADLLQDELDHPRAKEEYYKISLGSLIHLPKPIKAIEWKRLTFLYTTGAHLQTAQTLHDLAVKDEERSLLWKSLRERALAGGDYHADQLPDFPLDPQLLAFLGQLNQLRESSPEYNLD